MRRLLPDAAGTRLVDEARVTALPGFDTRVSVGFDAPGPGQPIAGYLLAFGASVRRCFAFVYTTTASGAHAEQLVGDRLAIMHTRSLVRIERRGDLDIAAPGR